MTPADQQKLRDRVHQRLAVYSRVAEAVYKDGLREHLWITIELHIITGQPSPAWVRTEIITAAMEAGLKNWEELFGEYPFSKHTKEETMVADVAHRMQCDGHKVNATKFFPDLADEIFKTHGVSLTPSTTKRRYYVSYRGLWRAARLFATQLNADADDFYPSLCVILGDLLQSFAEAGTSCTQKNWTVLKNPRFFEHYFLKRPA